MHIISHKLAPVKKWVAFKRQAGKRSEMPFELKHVLDFHIKFDNEEGWTAKTWETKEEAVLDLIVEISACSNVFDFKCYMDEGILLLEYTVVDDDPVIKSNSRKIRILQECVFLKQEVEVKCT